MRPAAASSRIFATEAGAARNSVRRCTSVSLARLGGKLERPVERRVAAAENHELLAVQLGRIAHAIVDALTLERLRTLDARCAAAETSPRRRR